MTALEKHALTAFVLATCWAVFGGVAFAESRAEDVRSEQFAAMRQICGAQDGQFDLSWIYNNQGLPWGRVMSCATASGFVACQGEVCRARRWQTAHRAAAPKSAANSAGMRLEFRAEPRAFAAALDGLAGR